jgi:hypothetical protein
MDWIWIACEAVAVATEDMPKEIVFGVREDGMTLAEVAADVGRQVMKNDDYMDRFDATVRTALLAASPGELIGPFGLHGRYVLIQVHEKKVPTIDTPETAKRAERAALEAALAREINDRVRWHWRV